MESTSSILNTLNHVGTWGILTTDAELRIVGWNPWLEEHSGKLQADVIGQHLFDLYPDLKERGFDQHFQQALGGQSCILSQVFHKYVFPMPAPGSADPRTYMQQTVRLSPLLDNDSICGTLTLIEDVTERIAAERELRLQTELLELAARQKDEFLAMLAHELRNPLAPIRNGIRILDSIPGDSHDGRQIREMLGRQVSHMARLVDDLLDISRIVRSKVTLSREPHDLVSVVRKAGEDYAAIVKDNGLNFTIDLPSDACWVEIDATRLSQIVVNLLHNANKFTNKGGDVRLHVKLDRHRQLALIRVSDTGIGMSADTLAKVFNAFAQADSSLERSRGGLGLGLALVKGLTELHGGTVDAFSEGEGFGSVFTISLPIKEVAPKEVQPEVITQQPRTINRVLIIEDNRDTGATLKILLKHRGFEVSVALTGPDGVEAARTFLPDVILCDIGLPGMDGFAVARALRSDPRTAKIYMIAQSGYGQADDIRKSLASGFDIHLVKPVDFTELSKVLLTRPETC